MSEEKLDVVMAELRASNAKLELLETKMNTKQEDAEPPAQKLTILLGIPALLIVIMMNWGQAGLNFQNQEKTIAETEKIRTEALKERAELQQILSKLENKDPSKAINMKQVVDELVPQIRRALDLSVKETASGNSYDATRLLGQYLLIWGLIFLVGLIFGIVYQIWSALLGILIQRSHTQANYKKEGFWKIVRSYGSSLYPFPRIGHWIVEVVIFLGIVVPFLVNVAYYAGASSEYYAAIEKLQSGEIGDAFDKFKSIYATTGGGTW